MGFAIERTGRDEPASPIASVDEEVVAALTLEVLGNAAPTLVAAPGCDLRCSSPPPLVRCRLNLNSYDQAAYLRHEIYVRAVADRHVDVRASAPQPLHRREFPNVALLPWLERRHTLEHTFVRAPVARW